MDKELLFWVWLLILAGLVEGYSWPRSQNPRTQRSRSGKSQKPNIVVIMTDDQDELLGNYYFLSPPQFFIYHGVNIAIAGIMN